MTAVSASVEVDRSAQIVFDYATDPARFHEWQQGVVAGHLDASSTPRVGDRCVTVRRIGFADRPIASEIVLLEPPTRWRVRGVDGPIRATVDVSVVPLGGRRSRLTIEIDFEGHGVGRLLVPFVVVREARKEMPGNLERLRRHLEAAPIV